MVGDGDSKPRPLAPASNLPLIFSSYFTQYTQGFHYQYVTKGLLKNSIVRPFLFAIPVIVSSALPGIKCKRYISAHRLIIFLTLN